MIRRQAIKMIATLRACSLIILYLLVFVASSVCMDSDQLYSRDLHRKTFASKMRMLFAIMRS